MNYLVFLDPAAGELEKILSGVKSMVLKEIDPQEPGEQPVEPGDLLYFLRDNDACDARVQATVARVWPAEAGQDEDLSRILKELQPRLQLTEDQYNPWSVKKQALLIEFEGAHKIEEVQVAPEKITLRKTWIAFEEIHQVTEEGVDHDEQ
jgi:hypothetical protein